ncbi:MAG: hypothetical protein ACR2N0_00435 [Rubrobacteraceae bacterium]|jgi:hypothetical protein
MLALIFFFLPVPLLEGGPARGGGIPEEEAEIARALRVFLFDLTDDPPGRLAPPKPHV